MMSLFRNGNDKKLTAQTMPFSTFRVTKTKRIRNGHYENIKLICFTFSFSFQIIFTSTKRVAFGHSVLITLNSGKHLMNAVPEEAYAYY